MGKKRDALMGALPKRPDKISDGAKLYLVGVLFRLGGCVSFVVLSGMVYNYMGFLSGLIVNAAVTIVLWCFGLWFITAGADREMGKVE